MPILNNFFHVTVLLVSYFCDQFVAPKIRHMQQMPLQCLSTINMVFSDEDKILIRSLYLKGYTANRLTSEFPEKHCTKFDVNKLLNALRDTGTVYRWPEI